MRRMCKQRGCSCQITKEAIERLVGHPFPGNVRELRHILQKAMALSKNGVITAEDIHLNDHDIHPPGAGRDATGPATAADAPVPMSTMESRYIAELLDRHNGNRRKVAAILEISERTLYRKINKIKTSLALI